MSYHNTSCAYDLHLCYGLYDMLKGKAISLLGEILIICASVDLGGYYWGLQPPLVVTDVERPCHTPYY